jgi:hypothetical protein
MGASDRERMGFHGSRTGDEIADWSRTIAASLFLTFHIFKYIQFYGYIVFMSAAP